MHTSMTCNGRGGQQLNRSSLAAPFDLHLHSLDISLRHVGVQLAKRRLLLL